MVNMPCTPNTGRSVYCVQFTFFATILKNSIDNHLKQSLIVLIISEIFLHQENGTAGKADLLPPLRSGRDHEDVPRLRQGIG